MLRNSAYNDVMKLRQLRFLICLRLIRSMDVNKKLGHQHLSSVMRKHAFYICENKGTDQLHSNRAADQCLCIRYIDSTIPLLPKSELSSL